MRARTFKAVIHSGHKEDAVEVPFDPGAEWGVAQVQIRAGRRGLPVRATVAGETFDSFLVGRQKRLYSLLPEDREGSPVGATVVVSVAPRH